MITDDVDHPGVAVLQRPECSPAGYGFSGPCAAMTIPVETYNALTVPIERDVTLVTAIWATAAPGQPVPPNLIGSLPPIPPVVEPTGATGAVLP